MTPLDPTEEEPRLGRKRDHSRDPEILDAALEVLIETGYAGMTVDMVATRAKAGKATLYRRWASKSELVIDAITRLRSTEANLSAIPDTGTLRGDLIATIKASNIRDGERKLKLLTGVASMIFDNPECADAVHAALVEPRASINRMLFTRAINRGEISADIDIDKLCTIGPALIAYNILLLRKPIDDDFLIANIDEVILPAAGL